MEISDLFAHVEQTARYKLPASTRVLVSRELRRLARVLNPNERLTTLAQGRLEDATGLIATTDRRIVFIGRQLVIEERILHAQRAEFPFSELQKVEAELRALSGRLTLHQQRRKVVFTDVNPPERATEIEHLARAGIAADRKARKPASRTAAAAGTEHAPAALGNPAS